jgi:hypothetical protein
MPEASKSEAERRRGVSATIQERHVKTAKWASLGDVYEITRVLNETNDRVPQRLIIVAFGNKVE